MIIHYLQHVPFENLGNIENWARTGAREVSRTRLFAGDTLPDLNQIDLLVILGGPMNIYETDIFPFLTAEKRFVEKAIKREKRVLGICLGAQIIADVLGAKVFRGEQEEIGWFPIERAPEAESDALGKFLPPSFAAFHWHGDTFDLPTGATHLASSAACQNQAFSCGDKILAVQFHLEATLKSVRLMIENEGEDLPAGEYVQTTKQIISPHRPFAENAGVMSDLLDVLTGGKTESKAAAKPEHSR